VYIFAIKLDNLLTSWTGCGRVEMSRTWVYLGCHGLADPRAGRSKGRPSKGVRLSLGQLLDLMVTNEDYLACLFDKAIRMWYATVSRAVGVCDSGCPGTRISGSSYIRSDSEISYLKEGGRDPRSRPPFFLDNLVRLW